jgi:hypothetical protein
MQLRRLSILASIVLCIAGCSKDDGYTDEQRFCIARHFSRYDSQKLDQCVDACIACRSGTTTTCTTSCKLKGAN